MLSKVFIHACIFLLSIKNYMQLAFESRRLCFRYACLLKMLAAKNNYLSIIVIIPISAKGLYFKSNSCLDQRIIYQSLTRLYRCISMIGALTDLSDDASSRTQSPKQRFFVQNKERVFSTTSSFCKQIHSGRFHVFMHSLLSEIEVKVPSYNVHFSSDNIQSFQQNWSVFEITNKLKGPFTRASFVAIFLILTHAIEPLSHKSLMYIAFAQMV